MHEKLHEIREQLGKNFQLVPSLVELKCRGEDATHKLQNEKQEKSPNNLTKI